MEQRNEGMSAASPPTKEHRLRRKLQKTVTRRQSNVSCRSGSGASNRARSPGGNRKQISLPRDRPSPISFSVSDPTPGDVSWARGSFYEPDSPTEPPEPFTNPREAPEPFHPVTRNPPQSSSSPASPAPAPKMRRRAKTPVLSIGQLEGLPRPNTLGRTSSVDLIADQYCAVLEARPNSYPDLPSEPLSPPGGEYYEGDDTRRRHSSVYPRDQAPVAATPRALFDIPACSPVSDDGTLVSFDGDTVYFKPIAVPDEPKPLPPPPPPERRASADGNVSLEICLDLLTRELASAFVGRPSRSSLSTSALQVWVMIEAYEKLRDQLAETGHERLKPVGVMFDMWLQALYSIHDSMTGRENDIGAELGTEELD